MKVRVSVQPRDVDALVGRRPEDTEPVTVQGLRDWHRRHEVAGGVVASLRAATFDMESGNDEAIAAAGSGYDAAGCVDLRDPLGAEREVRRLIDRGVRVIRFCPDLQGADPEFPGFRYLARLVADLGLLSLAQGDVRRVWRPFAGLGARVVFLDTHFYHLGDFLVLAREEPGFHTSTRLLGSPDALEIVAAEVGAQRLVFGTRAPYDEAAVPTLRLARSGLSADQRAAVASGNLSRLLKGASSSLDSE